MVGGELPRPGAKRRRLEEWLAGSRKGNGKKGSRGGQTRMDLSKVESEWNETPRGGDDEETVTTVASTECSSLAPRESGKRRRQAGGGLSDVPCPDAKRRRMDKWLKDSAESSKRRGQGTKARPPLFPVTERAETAESRPLLDGGQGEDAELADASSMQGSGRCDGQDAEQGFSETSKALGPDSNDDPGSGRRANPNGDLGSSKVLKAPCPDPNAVQGSGWCGDSNGDRGSAEFLKAPGPDSNGDRGSGWRGNSNGD